MPSVRVIGTKISDFNTTNFDSKNGLYKATPYKPTNPTYKSKAPYNYQPKNYSVKEYKPKTTGYNGRLKYEAKDYDHVYEYNPDYKGEPPKRVPRKTVPKVVVTPSPTPAAERASSPADSIKMWPTRFSPLASIKRSINMSFKNGSRVDPIIEPIPNYDKQSGPL